MSTTSMTATFSNLTEFAQFCAECVRQGVTFKAEAGNGAYVVRFTGGF